jgi:membrane fusion protein, heavy metal efflux system
MTKRNIIVKTLLLATFAMMSSSCKNNHAEINNSGYCLSESIDRNLNLVESQLVPVVKSMHTTAEISYNPDKVLSYVSLVSGVVSRTYFSLGDFVEKGQLMAELLSPELSSLYAERKVIEAQLTVANRQLKSTANMYESGIASGRELTEAISVVKSLEAEISRIDHSLSLFTPGREQGVFNITASNSGYVVNKKINPGSQVSAEGEALFTIADLSSVWVIVNIYPSDLTFVEQGMEAIINVPAYPGEQFHGQITTISRVFEVGERILKARIEMPNEDLRLIPGMLAMADLRKPLGHIAVSIPADAIIFSGDKHYVLSYFDACNIRIAEIKIAEIDNGTAYIESGIEKDEMIITRNQLLIYEQLRSTM